MFNYQLPITLKHILPILPYLPAYKVFPTPAPVPACFRQGSSYLRAYKAPFYILIFTFSLTSYGISSTKEQVRKNKLFLQNKANFQKVKLNVNKVLTRGYDQLDTWSRRTKQSQTKPNKAKLKKAKMNVTSYITKAYENKSPIWAPKKQSQTLKRQKPTQTYLPQRIMKKPPIWAPKKQTQSNPISLTTARFLGSHRRPSLRSSNARTR